jgi:hypothetical protein
LIGVANGGAGSAAAACLIVGRVGIGRGNWISLWGGGALVMMEEAK